jgi:hypothetical protein
MKLTKKDKAYLLSIGVNESDFQQMEMVSRYTKYEMFETHNESIVTKITQKKAIEILGRNTFLNGLHRCAFHSSAVRYSPDDKIVVLFDNNNFFKNK